MKFLDNPRSLFTQKFIEIFKILTVAGVFISISCTYYAFTEYIYPYAGLDKSSFSVMYVHALLFSKIWLLRYFHLKISVRAHEAKLSYLNSSQTQTILVVLSIAVSRNTNLFVHEKLTNLFSRTFSYSFMKQIFARKKK